MVKHIVVYTLKEGVDKEEAVKIIAQQLEPLVGVIPGLTKMEIRRAYQGMDYALYSEFESKEALIAFLPEFLREGDSVLVKASRGMHFEDICAALKEI